MRNAYFDQLDSIVDELVDMTREVKVAVARARDRLLERAGRIEDEGRRATFLADVVENQRTLALASELVKPIPA